MQQTESELQVELELTLLQINQLQEELESYYLEYTQLKNSSDRTQNTNGNQSLSSLNLLRQVRLNDREYLENSSEQCGKLQQVELDNKNAELKKLKELLDTRLSEVNVLRKQKQHLERKSQESIADNEVLSLQIHQLKEELVTVYGHKQTTNKHLQLANDEVEQIQYHTQVEIEQLGKVNKEQQIQIEELIASHELSESEIATLTDELSQTKEKLAQSKVQVVELELSKTDLESNKDSICAELEEVKSVKVQLHYTNTELQSQREELIVSLELAGSEIATLTNELSQMKEKLAQSKVQVVELELSKTDLESNKDSISAELEEVKSVKTQLHYTNTELQAQIEELKAANVTLIEQCDKMGQLYQGSNQETEKLKKDLDNISQSKVTIEEQVAELQEKQKKLEESLNSKDDKIALLIKDKEDLIYRQKLLDAEIVKTEAQLELVKDVVLREKAF